MNLIIDEKRDQIKSAAIENKVSDILRNWDTQIVLVKAGTERKAKKNDAASFLSAPHPPQTLSLISVSVIVYTVESPLWVLAYFLSHCKPHCHIFKAGVWVEYDSFWDISKTPSTPSTPSPLDPRPSTHDTVLIRRLPNIKSALF